MADLDLSRLKRGLRGAVSGEVRFDAGSRAMYANDFSIYRAVPLGVVIPRDAHDVIAGIAVCREYGAPVHGKRLLGIAPERDAPRFARRSLTRWFGARRRPPSDGRQHALLWPDTFTNLFEPTVGQAAVEVLEAAGFAVEVPERQLCCGRPLYDSGMLGGAKRVLRRTLDELSAPVDGRRGLRESWPAALTAELVFAIVDVAVSNYARPSSPTSSRRLPRRARW